MKLKIVTLLVLLTSCTSLMAEQLRVILGPGDISEFRYLLSSYPNADARKVATFRTSKAGAPCANGIWFDPIADPEAWSIALAGVTAGRNVEIRYETSSPSPWGDSQWCEAIWISLVP
ncbi:MAG: hypothetical protein MK096_00645 [Oleiphilaceae bacterium]|nr:hypothetical protein [Oleiphilaceae bacterium]